MMRLIFSIINDIDADCKMIDHCRDYDLDDDKDTVRIGDIGDQSMITE